MHQLRYQSDGRNWRHVIVDPPILDRYPSAVPIDRRNEQEKLVPSAVSFTRARDESSYSRPWNCLNTFRNFLRV